MNFFGGIAKGLKGDDSEEKTEQAPSQPIRKTTPKKEVTLNKVNSEDLDKTCENNYCIVGFVDTENGEVKESQKQVLDEILTKFKTDDKLLFTWVDKEESKQLLSKFSLSENTPSLVVYNSRRKRYLTSESFETPAIIKLIERVLTGDAVYKKCE